jgi:hypothetical protein
MKAIEAELNSQGAVERHLQANPQLKERIRTSAIALVSGPLSRNTLLSYFYIRNRR